MIHERWKEYRLSYIIAKVEWGQRSGIAGHQNHAAGAEQPFEETKQPWEQTQGEEDQVMGSRVGPKENGTKEAWGGAEQGTEHGEVDRRWTCTEQDLRVMSLRWL